MFTGIIEEIGTVAAVRPVGLGKRISVRCARVRETAALGDSIAVNGVCLTVVHLLTDGFEAEAVGETLSKTTIAGLLPRSPVNLESALRAGGKMGGHVVQGHVDFTAKIQSIEVRSESHLLSISYRPEQRHYLVPQGSVAIDGVSLTIARRNESVFTLAIIPHTWNETIFHTYAAGREVNVEVDIFGKYVIDYLNGLNAGRNRGGLTSTYLESLGY